MRQVRIKFIDWPTNWEAGSKYIINILNKRYEVVLSDTPDYVFCSVFGDDYLDYDCIRIFWTGECQTPDFNSYDYAIGFDRLSFEDRYFRMPLYHFYEDKLLELAKTKCNMTQAELDEKQEFANFVYSNKKAASYREELFDKLSEYKMVISGGKHRNNVGGPVKDKHAFLQQCKFTIACENAAYPGYTTEKILEAFAAHTIPIYWGNPMVEEDFNEMAFINCNRFATIDEVVEKVKWIDQNTEVYLNMMREPAFCEETLKEREEYFRQFLYHIFEQDIENAYRRNRGFWGKNYEGKLQQERKLSRMYSRYFEGHIVKIRKFWKRKSNT